MSTTSLIRWRRCGLCTAAILLCSLAAAGADVSIALVDGEVEVSGLPAAALDADDAATVLRVTVSEDAPPILGDYRVAGDTLRFRPMFPFDPGREYLVVVEIDGERFTGTVRTPAGDRTSTTLVTEIYPTADVLPENQLKLYIHFSAPMAGGDGLPFVKLVEEDGVEVVDPFLPLGDAFWDRERTRYTVFFDPGRVKRGILPNEQMGRPLVEGRRYTLVIDSDWRDAAGIPLAAANRKEFTAGAADETPIDPYTWTIHPPRPLTQEPLVVDLGEPLDHAILARALSIEEVEGEVEILDNETRWRFIPKVPWRPGPYHLVALGILEDLAGNQIGRPFEVDLFERIDSPDDVAEAHRILFFCQF